MLPATTGFATYGTLAGKDVMDADTKHKNDSFLDAALDQGQNVLDSFALASIVDGIQKGKGLKTLVPAALLALANHTWGAYRKAKGSHSNAFASDFLENEWFKPEGNQKTVDDLAKEANEKDKNTPKKPEQTVAKPANNTTVPNNTNTNQEAPAKKATTKATPTSRVSNQTGEMYTVNGKIPARTYWKEATNDRIEAMRNTADFKRSLQDYANTNLSQAEKERRAAADVIEWNRRKQRKGQK